MTGLKVRELEQEVVAYLNQHNFQQVATHSLEVAVEAERLCLQHNLNGELGYVAGLLHDISVVIPNEEKIATCRAHNLLVYAEEEQLPMITHQRLSKIMANEVFGVTDPLILEAISCHTTLKAETSQLDLLLFVADKIKWDQAGEPPYLNELLVSLDDSLEAGALSYITWLLETGVKVAHPWLLAAENWLLTRRKECESE